MSEPVYGADIIRRAARDREPWRCRVWHRLTRRHDYAMGFDGAMQGPVVLMRYCRTCRTYTILADTGSS